MASVERRGEGWWVRWREPLVTVDENGVHHRKWKERSRTFVSKRDAEDFAAERVVGRARGERFIDAAEVPTATIGTIARAYCAAASSAPKATQKFRGSVIGAFERFAGAARPVSDLSIALLERYAASLPGEGRAAATKHRKILEAERLWEWAFSRPETYPGVGQPRRITGSGPDKVKPPPPVVAMDAPSWADADLMIAQLEADPHQGGRSAQHDWHRRVAITLRYSGIRIGQALSLRWRDLDLDRGVLFLRAGVAGAKSGRTRAVPLHPALVEAMAGWGVREGYVFEHPRHPERPWRADAVVEPFRRAWERAAIAPAKWDAPDEEDAAPGDRAHGSPSHAFRRTVRSGLIRAGVEEVIAGFLVGHKSGATIAAYAPEGSPESSPYWPRLVQAVSTIPNIGTNGRPLQIVQQERR
jgi:integrase